jgi:Endonuclease/Exonuclease/phosphatase family
MPFYPALKREEPAIQRRAAEGVLRLKSQLLAEVPPRTVDSTLLLGTWNIREFDSPRYGDRLRESYFYIAEVVSRFDLIAIQEVRGDLKALKRLISILGDQYWDYLVTDVTLGRSGNDERLAFVYDTRKVRFEGLAGELVIPVKQKDELLIQFARTPYIAGFRSAWTRFNLCTVHIYYGTSKPLDPRRLKEIEDLAEMLKGMAAKSAENYIVLGDFNIFQRGDATLHALERGGFRVPDELRELPGSNVRQDKHYDQIATLAQTTRFGTTSRAGIFDFYKSVYRNIDEDAYAAERKEQKVKESYQQWRTYQMSDHLVMWLELKTDFGTEYLNELLENSATNVAFGQPIPEEAPRGSKKSPGPKRKTAKRKKSSRKKTRKTSKT